MEEETLEKKRECWECDESNHIRAKCRAYKNGKVSGEDVVRGIGEMTTDPGGPITRIKGMMTEIERMITETDEKTTRIVTV